MPATEQNTSSQVTSTNQFVSRGRKCSICEHPDVSRINTLLADVSVSKRSLAKQFDLTHAAMLRHANAHVPAMVKAAVTRMKNREGDIFMERHEHLFSEALQYVEDAKGAVKMQRVTVETPEGKLQERYQAFRDVGAMAPALTVATGLQRMLGDATGRFSVAQSDGTRAVSVSVMVPIQVNTSSPPAPAATIEVTATREIDE